MVCVGNDDSQGSSTVTATALSDVDRTQILGIMLSHVKQARDNSVTNHMKRPCKACVTLANRSRVMQQHMRMTRNLELLASKYLGTATVSRRS